MEAQGDQFVEGDVEQGAVEGETVDWLAFVDLFGAAEEEELAASVLLGQVTQTARILGFTEWKRLRDAHHVLLSASSCAREAAVAVLTIHRAGVVCCDVALKELILEAERAVRDVLILRTQLLAPLMDRQAFAAALDWAHVDVKPTTTEVEMRNELSRCMHAYRAVAARHFPGLGFASKSKEETAARGLRPKPRKVPKTLRGVDELEVWWSDPAMLEVDIPPPPGLELPAEVPGLDASPAPEVLGWSVGGSSSSSTWVGRSTPGDGQFTFIPEASSANTNIGLPL